jgi:hypothetical protein
VIFVDTGAWFAVAVGNDPAATDYVLAETATLIRMRDKTARGHRAGGAGRVIYTKATGDETCMTCSDVHVRLA